MEDFYNGKARCKFCHIRIVCERKVEVRKTKNSLIRCNKCEEFITGKRIGPGRKDGLYRCIQCQIKRNREICTTHQNNALKGEKAEQYRVIRNKAKKAWNERNPEAKRARSLILSTRKRLKQYDYDFTKFKRETTRELAKTIASLPKFCINCNTTEDLTIEHIQPVSTHPELALVSYNLTTLCRSCNTRSYYGQY